MGSVIATTKRENRRRDLWSSRLARLIFAWNIVGFAVLTLGALLLSELSDQLIQAKIDSLLTQGELIGNVLNETATVGDPTPELQQDRAIAVLSKLQLPAATRLRLFTPTGELVADSNTLSDRIVQRPLPSEKRATKKSQDEDDILARRITPWRPERTLEQERAIALRGDRATGQRVTDSGDRVISVSLPIQHVQAVLGVLTLESADVDEILAAERRSMLPFIVAAGAISLLFSALLA
jgi:two-component system sensor histidine kinase ChvG